MTDVRDSETAPGTAMPDRRITIIHYIGMGLATKDDLDFGATKVEMELRHWQSVISLTQISHRSNGIGNGKEYQSKYWKINALNQQARAEQSIRQDGRKNGATDRVTTKGTCLKQAPF